MVVVGVYDDPLYIVILLLSCVIDVGWASKNPEAIGVIDIPGREFIAL